MSLLSKLLNRRGDALRRAQDLGLDGASRLAAQLLKEAPPAADFASWQVDTLQAVQERLCRSDDDDLPDTTEVDAIGVTLRFIGNMPEGTRYKFSCLLVLIEAGGYILGPTNTRFTSLSGPEQDIYLRAWETSALAPQRAIFHALKSVCMMGYWTQPPTWGAIGYDLRSNPGAPPRLWEDA